MSRGDLLDVWLRVEEVPRLQRGVLSRDELDAVELYWVRNPRVAVEALLAHACVVDDLVIGAILEGQDG